jgi:hypothetical protein
VLFLVSVGLAGCSGDGLSAQDKQFAKDLAAAGVVVSESMAPLDNCGGTACLRRTGPVAAARIHRQIAVLAPRVAKIDDGCLRAAAGSFLGSTRAYESAARTAALGREESYVQAETHAGDLASRSLTGFAKCAPASARSLALLQADNVIADGIQRIDRCADHACRAAEGAHLNRLLDVQRRNVDGAFAHEHGCIRKTQGSFDRGLAAAKRMAAAVGRDDESAAAVAAAEAARLFDEGDRATGACIS